jgi:anti-sigma factor RsiW
MERYTAPDVLRARVRTAIATTPSSVADEQRSRSARGDRRRAWAWPAGVAAALVVSAALGSGVTVLATRARSARSVATEVLASHVRSLMPDHLTDVRSSDQHNVKPWFNGRLDYSPSVPRFDDQGFPLVGGRVDYVGGRPVAVVVYGRRQHMVNVFSWPASSGDAPLTATAENGYNMLHWRSGGSERWVVSDLNAGELRTFAGLLMSSP